MMDEAINSGAIAKISKPFELRAIVKLIECAVCDAGDDGGGAGGPNCYLII
jgi:hypothetical protein